MEAVQSARGPSPGKIPIAASIVLGALSFYAALGNYFFSGFSIFVFLFIVFGLVFLGLAFIMRTGRRVSLLASMVACLAYLALNLPVTFRFLIEPTAFPPFVFAVSAPPVAVLSILASLQAWRGMRQPTVSAPQGLARSRASAFFAFAVIGFVTGSLLIGGLAAATESTLLANSGASGNITIVVGAGNQGTALPYSPSPYTVKVGSMVTWVNKDPSTHTVTSFGSNLFDSGDMSLGGTFSFTFTQVGNYTYYCTIHPWMRGTIVVTGG